MCPKCNGTILRDYRSDEPPYCLQCGYVLIKVVSIDEGVSYRKYELTNAAVNMDDWEE